MVNISKENKAKVLEASLRGSRNRTKRLLAEYNNNPTICKFCGKILSYKKRKNKFCDHSCSASYNNKDVRRHGIMKKYNYCVICCKKLKKNSQRKFCSYKCSVEWNYNQYIFRWKMGLEDGIIGQGATSRYIRRYIFEKYNSECSECGWSIINKHTNLIPLQLEHIDGHWDNNDEDNLTLLCPNCHSLTSTYGGRNIGNGRPYRYKIKK